MKRTMAVLFVVSVLMLMLCACGTGPKTGTAVVSEEWISPEAPSGEFDLERYAMTPEEATPAYSAYYAYDREGNELFHEIYWFDEEGAVTDMDVTEMPEGAEIAHVDYTELDADGNERWSEHMDY